MSSSRLRNSGLNATRTTAITASRRCSSVSEASISAWLPRFDVRISRVFRKSTVRPWPSVSRPSSSTCSRMSKTSGVRLLDLVEQDHRVRPAAHRLGQLAALLVSDVAGRGTDEPCHRVLLGVLAHVDADHGARVVEQEVGERLGQLGLADAGRARRTGTSRSAGRGRRCRHAPGAPRRDTTRTASALADDATAELLLHPQQLLGLALQQPAGRDSGPGRDHRGDVVGADLLADHRRLVRVDLALGADRLATARAPAPGIVPYSSSDALARSPSRWARSACMRSSSSSFLSCADPVQAGLLLLPARRQRRQLLAAVGQVAAQPAEPLLRRRIRLLLQRQLFHRQPVDRRCSSSISTGRSRSPSAAGTRPRRSGRWPCPAGTAR